MVKVGDTVTVKVYEIDSMGRLNLSIKRAAPRPRRDATRPAPASFRTTPRRPPVPSSPRS